MLKEKRSSQKIPRFSEKAIPNPKKSAILSAVSRFFRPGRVSGRRKRRDRRIVFFRFFSKNELIFSGFMV